MSHEPFNEELLLARYLERRFGMAPAVPAAPKTKWKRLHTRIANAWKRWWPLVVPILFRQLIAALLKCVGKLCLTAMSRFLTHV